MSLTVTEVLRSPRTSEWLRAALLAALARDPADAANDAELLRDVLMRRIVAETDGRDAAHALEVALVPQVETKTLDLSEGCLLGASPRNSTFIRNDPGARAAEGDDART